jgi:uncharacterized repeat protein (TIGR01451 family)
MADFNGDGVTDLAVANGTSADVSVLIGNASGGFAPDAGSPNSVGAFAGPSGMVVTDVNSDGRPDLAVSNFSTGTVAILQRNAGGGFSFSTPINAGTPFSAIAAADFNGDSLPDLAVARWNTADVVIYLRTAGGGYAQEAGPPPAGTNPRSIAVGDFNSDGRPDLAVTNIGSHNLTILLRNPAGGFIVASGSPIAVGTNPFGVVAADFNGDSKVDLAVANSGSDNVTVLNGTGSGTFTSAGAPIGVGDAPITVAAGDLNRDGFLDLAVTNNTSGDLSILLGNGSSGFSPLAGTPLSTGTNAFGVAVGRLNADGAPDVAVTNTGPDNVSILLSNCIIAGLGVSMSDAPDPVGLNTDFTYSITAQNSGPDAARVVSLGDELPNGTTFVTANVPAGWLCTTPPVGSGGRVGCFIDTLPFSTIQLSITVRSATPGTLLNTATIAASTADPVGLNNSASTSTLVPGPCSPRPKVSVLVSKAGTERLQVAVTASADPINPTNRLTALSATIPANARLDVPNGPNDLTGQQSLPVGDGTQPVIFFIRRIEPGALTVPMRATDGCGEWPTFVGVGGAAF